MEISPPLTLSHWCSIACSQTISSCFACEAICSLLSHSLSVSFSARRLPNGIRICFTFIYFCFTVRHPCSAFTTTCSHQLPVVDNSYAQVYLTSLLTAEPQPWPSEQDVYITGTEQDNNETGIAGLQQWLKTGRRCQAVHALPPVGSQQQHYIDRFDTGCARPVLGQASRYKLSDIVLKWTVM